MTQVLFADRVWNVRDEGYIKRGPGPNAWTKDNAWVDSEGKLQLMIEEIEFQGFNVVPLVSKDTCLICLEERED